MAPGMKDYILEQGSTLETVIDHAPAEVEIVLKRVGRTANRIFLIGSGTSLNAAIAARYYFLNFCDVEVQVIPPFDFVRYFPTKRITRDSLVIGISQTARSTGVIEAINLSRSCGARTVFVTATPDAEGAQTADVVMNTWTGPEIVGPKTKGFTSTLASLYTLAAGMAGKIPDLAALPGFADRTIETTINAIPRFIDDFSNASSVKIVSYGPCMAAAHEGGLKLLETVRRPVEVYDVEEFKHGPYHCLENDTHMIFLAPPGKGQEPLLKLLRFVRSITRHILVISSEEPASRIDPGILIPLPHEIDEMLTPICYVVPVQWLANDVTIKQGRSPEVSRYPDFHKILGSKSMPKV